MSNRVLSGNRDQRRPPLGIPGISQNYIPAIEASSRQAGPKLQEQLVKYFGCRFEDLFEVMLIDPESRQEQVLVPK